MKVDFLKMRWTRMRLVLLVQTVLLGQVKASILNDSSYLRIGNPRGGQKTAHLYGHINYIGDSIHIRIYMWKGYASFGQQMDDFITPVDKQGDFHLKLEDWENPGRLQLIVDGFQKGKRDGRLYLMDLLVDPGDSICIHADITNPNPRLALQSVSLKGRGAEKIRFALEFSQVKMDSITNHLLGLKVSEVDRIRAIDSAMKFCLENLDRYKVGNRDYATLRCNMVGALLRQEVVRIDEKILNSSLNLAEGKGVFERYNDILGKYFIFDATTIASSESYMRFLIEKEQLELALKKGVDNYGLDDFYRWMEKKYKRVLREKLLTYYFVSNDKRSGGYFIPIIDPQQYYDCLKDAYTNTQTPALKERLFAMLRLGKGAEAYDFNFPLDSSDSKVKLSDLKGKVILLDAWGYNCTGCVLFSSTFHKKIFPLFKGNPQFAVASLMLNSGVSRKDYFIRLRNLVNDSTPMRSGTMFTSPDYINLFGGIGEKDSQALVAYYHVNSLPFILLIDKKGRVYSSSVPFFQDDKSQNIQKLIDLIRQALAEPA